MVPAAVFRACVAAAALLFAACSQSSTMAPSASSIDMRSVSLPGEAVTISTFADLPNTGADYPIAITAGPDGALWVADDVDQDFGNSFVARIDTNGKRTAMYQISTNVLPSFSDIVTGPDGALWIADGGDYRILSMTTSGKFSRYPLKQYTAPYGITAGPDKALWFTAAQRFGPAIGRITTTGQVTYYTAGISSGAVVQDIAAGPDGALWFTESKGDRIGRITTAGKITEFSKGITPGSQPYAIAAGADGALWFTELGGSNTGAIGRITTAGAVTEYHKGITPTEAPHDIAAGPGGMWFTEFYHNQGGDAVARITYAGTVTQYTVAQNSNPVSIAKGPDGNMWFVEEYTSLVGRVNL